MIISIDEQVDQAAPTRRAFGLDGRTRGATP